MSKINETILENIRQEFVQGIEENEQKKYPTIDELKKKYIKKIYNLKLIVRNRKNLQTKQRNLIVIALR